MQSPWTALLPWAISMSTMTITRPRQSSGASILVATGLIYDPHVAGGNVEICGNGMDDDGDGTIDEPNTVANPNNCYELTVNKGIIFALDVTDPYDPQVLWERSYDTPEFNPVNGKHSSQALLPVSVLPGPIPAPEKSHHLIRIWGTPEA